MGSKFSGLLVTFDKDVHEDDIELRVNAVRMIKGVLSVKPIVSDPMGMIGAERMRYELWATVREALFPKSDK